MKIPPFLLVLCMPFCSFGSERIEKSLVNTLKAERIYMSFGRSTVIKFPCNVVSFSDGPTRDIQGLLNERNSQMLEVWFAKQNPEPQELKVFCSGEDFVFDIVPSQTKHQSIFEVSGSFKSRTKKWGTTEKWETTEVISSEKTPKSSMKFTQKDPKKLPKIIKVIKGSNE